MTANTLTSARLSPLQKAAILIHSLDMRSADALLDQMPAEQASRVRDALLELDDVPAEAQERVISEFLSNGGRLPVLPAAPNDSGVELDLSDAAVASTDNSATAAYTTVGHFDFLKLATPSLLSEFLRLEHPQTVAVVLANVEPDQAARVLERLPSELSTESLARMARLYQLTDDVLADLADEIRLQLLPRIEAERRPQGLAGASAVLSALNDSQRKQMLGKLAHRDHALVRQLGYLNGADSLAKPKPTESVSIETITHETAVPVPAVRTTSRIQFEQLTTLGDDTLKRIFAAAEPQTLLLALTGADDRLIQRILRQLPAAEATALRQRLNHPGPLRLRDVDAAQQQLSQIAVEMHELRQIRLPFLPVPSPPLSLQS